MNVYELMVCNVHCLTHYIIVVEVDLTADHFRPGKPNYERVKWSLEERLGEGVRFVLCHLPAGNIVLARLTMCRDSSVGRASD